MIINEENLVNQINFDSNRLINKIKSLCLPDKHDKHKKSIKNQKSCQRCEKNKVRRTCQNCFPLRWFCLVCDEYIHSLESKKSHIVTDVPSPNSQETHYDCIIIENVESFEVKNKDYRNSSLLDFKISNETVVSLLGKESNLVRNLVKDYENCILSLFNQNEKKQNELKMENQKQNERILQLNNSLLDYESIFDDISSRFISIEEEYRKLILDLRVLNKNKNELEKENKSLLMKINQMKTKNSLLVTSQRSGFKPENKNKSFDYNDKYVNRDERIEKPKDNPLILINEAKSDGFNYDYDYNSYNIHKNKTRKVN